MADSIFQLCTLTRFFEDEEMRVTEALGFPEISALDASERNCQATLRSKAKAILEDPSLSPALSLFRRRFGPTVELDEIELTLDPPARLPDWQEPVTLKLHFARWIEQDMQHAYLPALGVLVFATRAAPLAERVQEHVRLVIAGRRTRVGLRELARIARVQSLTLGRLDVTAHIKTPRQIAEAGDEEEKEPSMLARLAEELPPFVANKSAAEPTPYAFELEAELGNLAEALTGPLRRSVLLVGPAGGGKSALVREFARRRRDFGFAETPFWSTSGARLMTGPIGFGMWQERCQQMCREASQTNAILHVGNLAELLEVGKASRGQQSVGGFLRPWIARGDISVIAECTAEQLGAIERLEPHLAAAFRQLTLAERAPEQTRAILDGILYTVPSPPLSPDERFASNLALDRIHQLHQRYATYSANPGRPVRFLKNLLADRVPPKTLTEAEVVAGFSRETGLPLVLLDDQIPLDLEATRNWFEQRVIGQPAAVARVLDLLALAKARLARPRKPLASLLLIGPTGTGKTELAKALATFLFGDPSRMVRFDLNEFSDPASVLRLFGGPSAGEAEGLLTARVREQPFSVVLLDEFEKADPSFFDLLLQILGDGRLTDGTGRVADFCNSVIVMTSNLGALGFQHGPAGFRADGGATLDAQEHFTTAVQQFLRPEIFNRLDAVVPFQPLAPEIILAITRREIELALQRDGLRLRPVELRLSPEVAEHLAARGYDVRYGARPLKRALERELLVPLAEALNGYSPATPVRAEVDVAAGQLRVHVHARTEARPEHAQGAARAELLAEIVSRRRRVGRLQHGSAAGTLENRATLLAALERRLTRAQKKHAAPDPRLAPLPQLRECREGIDQLAQRACGLEDAALAAVYRNESFDRALFVAELNGISTDLRRLQREAFRLLHPGVDDIVLAFYSEHQGTLFEFAAAYHAVGRQAGKVLAIEALKPPHTGRASNTRLVHEVVENAVKFFAKPPEKVIGIVMHLRGDLFQPRFVTEAGLHEIKEKNTRRICLIHVASTSIKEYVPPRGIERKGSIESRGAELRRGFDRAEKVVTDAACGESPWPADGIEHCIAALTEERLAKVIEAATM